MWVMTNRGWMSIVKHRYKQDTLLIRARNVDPLLMYFSPTEIVYNYHSDYAWRVETSVDYCFKIMATEIHKINYGNFKDSVENGPLIRAYHKVWSIGLDYQLDEEDSGLAELNRRKRFCKTKGTKSKRNRKNRKKSRK